MSVQFDSVPRSVADQANITVTTGVAAIGGGIGVRVIIDGAVLTSREQAYQALSMTMDLLLEKTWPVT